MPALTQKLRRILAISGVIGVLVFVSRSLLGHVRALHPARFRQRLLRRRLELDFDRRWAVETSAAYMPPEETVTGVNWVHGVRYEGVDPGLLDRLLPQLNLRYEDYTYVDLGAGKGRSLLLASRFPFRRVVGVEYAEALCATARDNLRRFARAEIRCGGIEVVHGDAGAFALPAGPLLIFMFNPFGEVVMRQVAENVGRAFAREPRDIVVAYFVPRHPRPWAQLAFLEEIRVNDAMTLFVTKSYRGCRANFSRV